MYANPPQDEIKVQARSPNHRSPCRIIPINRGSRRAEDDFERMLSCALQAADREFGGILHEVDEVSRVLRSDTPDNQTVKSATDPAVRSAVKQTLLDRELHHLALTDDLTGLYNRRGFFAAATHLLKLSVRNTQSLLLLFCDFDNLKKINDAQGHREGDRALMRTAEAMERSFRSADVLARIGGDEFAVLALENSRQGREIMFRRFGNNLRKMKGGNYRIKLSVSVGAARFDPRNPVSLGELMLEADKAMHKEKRKRRKFPQTVPLPERGRLATLSE